MREPIGAIAAVIVLVGAGLGLAACGGHGGHHAAPSTDSEVTIIAMDDAANRVVSVDDMSGSGWQTYAPSGVSPEGVFVDRLGRIYFTDGLHHRIGRVDGIGGGNPVFYTPAPGVTTNFGPNSVFVDELGHITISDSNNGQVLRIDDMTGTNPLQWGTPGSGDYQLSSPRATYVRGDGAMFIADFGNHRVVEYSQDGFNWSAQTNLGLPTSVWLDAQGRIYVCDPSFNRIVRMNDISGAGWVQFDHTANGDILSGPRSVFVDHQSGRIYIADVGHHRIVRMDDMTGAGWTVFGANGTGTGQFLGLSDVKVVEMPYALTGLDRAHGHWRPLE